MNYTQTWRVRTDLSKNEYWKLEKDGLEILKELDRLSTTPFEQIDVSDIERLKWAGIYCQRPKNGKFLIRIKLPSGKLNAAQGHIIADLAEQYGQSELQITIRQCIQIHNLTLNEIPDIFRALDSVGLTTVEGCGDVPRNILGNPLMGVDPEELFDTEPIVNEAVRRFVGNPDYANLPRKYKLSFSANPHDVGYAGINDLAFVPAVYGPERTPGFHIRIGGGLSSEPKLSKPLNLFVLPERAVDVAEAVACIFRDRGYRTKRNHCRLKYLIEDIGAREAERLIEAITGPLPHGGRTLAKSWNRGNFYGIHKQKQPGLYYAGLCVTGGVLPASDFRKIVALSEKYGDGQLRTTNTHQFIILNIPEDRRRDFRSESILSRYPLRPKAFSGYQASCTGRAYCSFAPIETKHALNRITAELDERFPNLRMPIRINLTGCPHSCAHPQIADIGFTGGKMKTADGILVDAYAVAVGGHLGPNPHFGTVLKNRIPADQATDLAADFVRHYLNGRKKGERFYEFVDRTGADAFQDILDRYQPSVKSSEKSCIL